MSSALLCLTISTLGCTRASSRQTPARPAPSTSAPEHASWLLQGTTDERFIRVAQHLRGFDVAMVETGYRYAELYWAGQDQNWEYAKYQVDKVRTAIQNGVARRPRRAQPPTVRVSPTGPLPPQETAP
jgi:hypothetical protein